RERAPPSEGLDRRGKPCRARDRVKHEIELARREEIEHGVRSAEDLEALAARERARFRGRLLVRERDARRRELARLRHETGGVSVRREADDLEVLALGFNEPQRAL